MKKEYIELSISLANLVKSLINENESLKEEIELLEKMNGKLLKEKTQN